MLLTNLLIFLFILDSPCPCSCPSVIMPTSHACNTVLNNKNLESVCVELNTIQEDVEEVV